MKLITSLARIYFFMNQKDPWLVFDNNNENSISIIVDKILDELKRKNLV